MRYGDICELTTYCASKSKFNANVTVSLFIVKAKLQLIHSHLLHRHSFNDDIQLWQEKRMTEKSFKNWQSRTKANLTISNFEPERTLSFKLMIKVEAGYLRGCVWCIGRQLAVTDSSHKPKYRVFTNFKFILRPEPQPRSHEYLLIRKLFKLVYS